MKFHRNKIKQKRIKSYWLLCLVIFIASCEKKPDAYVSVPLVSLIVAPEKYDGNLIIVSGFLSKLPEKPLVVSDQLGNELMQLERGLTLHMTSELASKLDVDAMSISVLPQGVKTAFGSFEECSGQYALVFGRFHAKLGRDEAGLFMDPVEIIKTHQDKSTFPSMDVCYEKIGQKDIR